MELDRSERKPRWRKAWSWAWQIGLVVLVYALFSAWQERRSVTEGEPAPAFELSTLDGQRISSAELRGKRVLLHFWATWCGVCRAEISSLKALEQSLPDDTRLFSVVANSDELETVRAFVREHDIRYPVLLADAATLRRFGVRAFPTNYYLDEQGRVSDVTVGLSTRWAMRLRLHLAD